MLSSFAFSVPHLVQVTCTCFEFSLDLCVVCVCCGFSDSFDYSDVNPLSSNSDENEISLYTITICSNVQVMK